MTAVVTAGATPTSTASTHVAVVLEDDPAARPATTRTGRFYYFAPDELEPLPAPRARDAPMTPRRRVLVAGIGNLFLGDDGFGSEVARRLAGDAAAGRRPGRRLRHPRHAPGLRPARRLRRAGRRRRRCRGDGRARRPVVLEVGPDDLGDGELDAHGMAPVAVLASLGPLGGPLPPTYVVGCQPADVGEGIGPDPAGRGRRRPGRRRSCQPRLLERHGGAHCAQQLRREDQP